MGQYSILIPSHKTEMAERDVGICRHSPRPRTCVFRYSDHGCHTCQNYQKSRFGERERRDRLFVFFYP